MAVPATSVKTLRDRTNLPFMECKAALEEAGGDMEKAIEVLRKKFAKVQVARGERETAEGRVATQIDDAKQVGAIVEVRCESAPVAKSEAFAKLGNDIARHIAEKNPANVDDLLKQPFVGNTKLTVNERIGETVGLIRENIRVARFTRLTGGKFGSYCHHDCTLGVLLQVEGVEANPEVLRDVCMHIAARNPMAGRREDVPANVIAKEKELAAEQAKASGKPANIAEKIAEGKMKTWYAENVLLEQPFVKDEAKMVGDLLKGAGLKFVRFVRYKVGEIGG
jgi:elongation factor Ts